MSDILFQESLIFARQISNSPYDLCKALGIDIVSDKPMLNDGYLVCERGYKLIFVSSRIQNFHRRKFVVSHEIGHFFLHRAKLYSCANISEISFSVINTSKQENEANQFASEYLMPQEKLAHLLPPKHLHFSDISKIASFFDVSMTFAALKSVRLSKTEDEILICYDGQKLKWFASADPTLHIANIPAMCPVDLSNVPSISNISGIWDSLYEGNVHQEVFNPFENQRLVLLSGNRLM